MPGAACLYATPTAARRQFSPILLLLIYSNLFQLPLARPVCLPRFGLTSKQAAGTLPGLWEPPLAAHKAALLLARARQPDGRLCPSTGSLAKLAPSERLIISARGARKMHILPFFLPSRESEKKVGPERAEPSAGARANSMAFRPRNRSAARMISNQLKGEKTDASGGHLCLLARSLAFEFCPNKTANKSPALKLTPETRTHRETCSSEAKRAHQVRELRVL